MRIFERGSREAEQELLGPGFHFLLVAYQLFPTWEYFVPNVGIIYSQRGNNL